jgi:hypothetical protein
MRLRLIVALIFLFGTGILGVAYMSTRVLEEESRNLALYKEAHERPLAPPPADGLQPTAVVDKTEHNFGEMGQHEIGRHSFTIRNEGEFPLKLAKGETSCKCTLSDLAQDQIAPGGEGQIQLEWKTLLIQGEFRQTAEILTNDPKLPRINLVVVGKIRTPVRIVPKELVFTNLVASEGASAQVQVFATGADDFKLGAVTFQNPETAASFDVSSSQIAAKDLPPDAASGWQVDVTVKPGLPYGRIQQTIRLETNLPGFKTVEIPVQAAVRSYFSILGPDWDADRGVLKLGVIPSREGAARKLKLLIRGPKRKELRLLAPVSDPSLIEVTVGEPVEISEGSLVQVPLTVRIPPGSPNMNHLGSDRQGRMGEINIETSEADYGPLRLKVQFAIED